jgi:hypothetical protein
MLKLGLWLFNLGCKINPAIPLAMNMDIEQRVQAGRLEGFSDGWQAGHTAHAEQCRAELVLAQHQQTVARRAARQ